MALDTSFEATCRHLRLCNCVELGRALKKVQRNSSGRPVGARGHVIAIRREAKIIFASFLVSFLGVFIWTGGLNYVLLSPLR